MSINWFTHTSYLKYKNECLHAACKNLKISETNSSGNNIEGEKCKSTTYEDYLRFKNMKLMVQDISGDHVSLTGNSNTINM